MSSDSLRRAQIAWEIPPEPQLWVCQCGDSEEDHDELTGCNECICDEFVEYTREDHEADLADEAYSIYKEERE